ncbi:hypothetical protein HELRODRAFT_173201 [Helobdella robusta]|uniref:Uncharacterized protein n=1 Tax=Helobdella robusta TaxID=6412 RepID=T1F6J9_HELRO|nr:hypothetical protein HELRODRAFT_173201 [Helobdella robusta]ESO04113.1 hypothetical protein HELRODRAFT_173201 [Helobdella robusta]
MATPTAKNVYKNAAGGTLTGKKLNIDWKTEKPIDNLVLKKFASKFPDLEKKKNNAVKASDEEYSSFRICIPEIEMVKIFNAEIWPLHANEYVEPVKNLGVWIDPELKMNKHVKNRAFEPLSHLAGQHVTTYVVYPFTNLERMDGWVGRGVGYPNKPAETARFEPGSWE